MAGTRTRTVREVMATALRTVTEADSIDVAARIMERHEIRQVLVLDDRGDLVGLVSYRALLRLLSTHRPGEPTGVVPVADVMERDPPTIGPDAPLLDAVRLMLDRRLSVLPVTDGPRPLGVLSEHDILGLTGRLMERHPETW